LDLCTVKNFGKFVGNWFWFARHSGLCSARSALPICDVMPSEKLIAYLIAKICLPRGEFLSLPWVFQTIFAVLLKMQWRLNPRSAI